MRWAWFLFLMLWPQWVWASLNVLSGAPDGFEQLETEKPTVISLYYGGNFLGNYPARMTPGTVQFENSHLIVAALNNISDKEKITRSLQQPLPINADRLCTEKKTDDCGVLTPDITGIIFNPATLNGELFINKHFLTVSSDQNKFLPLPERKLSSVYMFNGAANGVDGNNNFTLAGDGIVSFGETKLSTASSISDNGVRFDRMELLRDRNGWQAGGGLFRSRAMRLVNDADIAGVNIATSERTILDQNKTQGNDILLYLPRRSFVSIYRDGRLYSSRAYEAGNQLIDTRDLPEGAYTITLRIQEADGSTREEQRFFAKNQEIPPADRPVYYAQAGVMRAVAFNDNTIPKLSDKPIITIGTVRRMTDTIGMGIGVTGINDRAASESGIYWLRDTTQLRFTALVSTQGDVGFNSNLIYNREKLTASVDARQLSVHTLPELDYQPLFSDIKQVSGTIAYALQPDVTLGGRVNYSAQKNTPSSMTIGPYAYWRIWQRGESSLEFNADFARTNNRNQGDLLLRFTHRFGPNYGMTGSAGGGYGTNAGTLGNIRGWYERTTPDEYLQIGAGASRDRRNNILSTDADWRNKVGQLRGSVQQAFGESGSSLGYGGNFAIGAAQIANHLHVGGSQNDQSAIVVSTKGDAKTKMTVFVNGTPRSTVRVGQQQVIYLSPYHSYNIRIAPEKPGLYHYNGNDRRVTLYPGNVVHQEWQVDHFYVVLAQIIDAQGRPLPEAILQESRDQVTTDLSGNLQAELPRNQALHFIKADQTTCRVQLPAQIAPINGALIYPDPLICQQVTVPPSQPIADRPISYTLPEEPGAAFR